MHRIGITFALSLIAVGGCASRTNSVRRDPTAQQATATQVPVTTTDPTTTAAVDPGANGTTADANRMNERSHASTEANEPSGASVTDDDARTTDFIKKALLDDKTLSFPAKNVEVSTSNGKVTLRGVVANEQERQVVEDQATRVVGTGRVDNQVQIRD